MTLTHDYVCVPRRLLVELRDTPLALALYLLVARLFLVQHAPVPLSRGDLRAFDPHARDGALKRALDRLTQAGWLLATPGPKTCYLPCWGRSRAGAPYPWRSGAPRLGCPTFIPTLRVARALLDVFMGRLQPHPRNAHIERYVTQPLLDLQDIGAYLLHAAALPAAARAGLLRWGLLRDGQAQAVPDPASVLALASQQASATTFQLTAAGWRRLGWRPPAPRAAEAGTGVPLFFVPLGSIGAPIGGPIGGLIGEAAAAERPASAAARAEVPHEIPPPTMPGTHAEIQEIRENPPTPPITQAGGGILSVELQRGDQASAASETTGLLHRFGVRDHKSIADLAHLPAAQVGAAIGYAVAEGLGPGWLVSALRRQPTEDWSRARGRSTRGGAIDVDAALQRYGDLFRRGGDLADLEEQPEHLGGRRAEHAARPSPTGRVTGAEAAASQAPLALPDKDRQLDQEPTEALQQRLLVQCGRAHRQVIARLRVRVVAGTTVVHCATLADRMAAQAALLGPLRGAAAELGLPTAIAITDSPPAPWERSCDGACRRPALE